MKEQTPLYFSKVQTYFHACKHKHKHKPNDNQNQIK